MAEDTELPPEEGAETVAAPVEGEDTTAQTNPEIEALASKMGWAPQDQFRGDPAEWRSAEDYILASKDINRSLNRKLSGLEEQLSRVGNVTTQIIADKIAERDAYWQNTLNKAVADGDHELADKAVGEIVKLKAAPAQDTGEPPETQQFKERHKAWFGPDKNGPATRLAMRVAEEARLMGASIAEQLQDAEEEVRARYPNLFPAPAKKPAAVQTGTSRNNGSGSGKKGYADMPAASQALAQDYLKRHGTPLEKFAESYWADQAQNERRVG